MERYDLNGDKWNTIKYIRRKLVKMLPMSKLDMEYQNQLKLQQALGMLQSSSNF